MTEKQRIKVNVVQANDESERVRSYCLVSQDGSELPAFTAGAHIDLCLPNGLVRSYSLTNAQSETHRYVVAVACDRNSRGGSEWIHQNLKVGDSLVISTPRNNFRLEENAQHTVLLAGGIGVTPLLSMARQLNAIGRPWHLYFVARSRNDAPFTEELLRLSGNGSQGKVELHFDEGDPARRLNLATVFAAAPSNTHFYCCGPSSMLASFQEAGKDWPEHTLHLEYFGSDAEPATAGGFEVVLAKTGRTVVVRPGDSILDTLLDLKINVPFSCMEGVCGECLTRVLDGTPDHRDMYLTESEKKENKVMMICCSGCKGKSITLDV